MDSFFDDSEATDIAYINIRDGFPGDYSSRKHVEDLYKETSHLLDKKFYSQRLHDFFACYAEMYFASAFMRRGGHKLSHPSDKGLDFFIKKLNCWLEVVKATNGNSGLNPDTIAAIDMKNYQGYPEDKIILRLTSAIQTKWDKIQEDIDKLLIEPNQPIVICISGAELHEPYQMHHSGGYPQIVKAVFPVGDTTFWLSTDTKKIVSKNVNYKNTVNKSKGGPIHTEYFTDPKYSCISAVIYSSANATGPIATESEKRGCDFFTVHNPLATNPLPPGFVNCGIEYFVDIFDDRIYIQPPVDHESTIVSRSLSTL